MRAVEKTAVEQSRSASVIHRFDGRASSNSGGELAGAAQEMTRRSGSGAYAMAPAGGSGVFVPASPSVHSPAMSEVGASLPTSLIAGVYRCKS